MLKLVVAQWSKLVSRAEEEEGERSRLKYENVALF
jgi:hypothetical protein